MLVNTPSITEREIAECDKLRVQIVEHLPAKQFNKIINDGKALDLGAVVQALIDE